MITLDQFKEDPELMFDFIDFFFKFKPHLYQKKFLISCLSRKRVLGIWPRQSGKSQNVAVYSLFRCIIHPTSIMITAPTQTQSSELYNKIRNLAVASEAINVNIVKSTQTEMLFKNGSRIKALPTGVEGKSIRGFTADIVIIEEAGIMKDEIINSVITPMLASKKDDGQIIKIGTPLTKNHFYRSCFIDPQYDVIKVNWKDCVEAKQYTLEFVEEQRRNLTDVEFQTEYEAQFIEEFASFFSSALLDNCTEDYPLIRII